MLKVLFDLSLHLICDSIFSPDFQKVFVREVLGREKNCFNLFIFQIYANNFLKCPKNMKKHLKFSCFFQNNQRLFINIIHRVNIFQQHLIFFPIYSKCWYIRHRELIFAVIFEHFSKYSGNVTK